MQPWRIQKDSLALCPSLCAIYSMNCEAASMMLVHQSFLGLESAKAVLAHVCCNDNRCQFRES